MMGIIIGIHVAACALLIVVILIQAGRGGGLVEGFSGVESMFGTKTNLFLTRTTTALAALFFVTCVSLALLSARQSRSLMRNIKTETAPGTSLPLGEDSLPQQVIPPASGETPKAP
jgi:preprotein translocase subunit SecG